ncbi:MAG: hypothetical protein ACI9RO_002257, partial [Alteromonas macleodii]
MKPILVAIICSFVMLTTCEDVGIKPSMEDKGTNA